MTDRAHLSCPVVVWKHEGRRYALPAPGGPAPYVTLAPRVDDPAWTFLGTLHAGTPLELLEQRLSLHDLSTPVRCELAGAEVLVDVAAIG
jgi:hypothetical protein